MDTTSCVTPISRQMIRLSHLAYDKPSVIGSELAAGMYGLEGWGLKWGPVEAEDRLGKIDNLAFVAGRGSGDEEELAVVIRGTTRDSVESVFDDIDIKLDSWPYVLSGVSDARVASGLLHVFHQMTTEKPQGAGVEGSGKLADFLTSAGVGRIHVTGHSQGGATASMMAAYVDHVLRTAGSGEGLAVSPCTFAGETAGNAAFAEDLTGRFGGSWRFANVHDIVPKAWANLKEIDHIYDPVIKTPFKYKALVWGVDHLVSHLGYTQPDGVGCQVPSEVTSESFLAEMAHQHHSQTYIDIMDAAAGVATKSAGV